MKKAVITGILACVTLWHCAGCANTNAVLDALLADVRTGVQSIVADLCERTNCGE